MGCGCGCGGNISRKDVIRRKVREALREDEELSDVDVEEGKMSGILGVPDEARIGDAYEGSAQEAAQEVVDAVGEDEAASMINYAANISGDSFLEDMQDALKNIGNEQNETMRRNTIRNLVREALSEVMQEQEPTYQEFVKDTMDKLGIDSPKDLTDDGKSTFFTFLDDQWDEEEDTVRDDNIEKEIAANFEPSDFDGDAPDMVENNDLTERVAKRAARRLVKKLR